MDSFNNIISAIPGSRHPILVPALTDNISSLSDTLTPPSPVTSNTLPIPVCRNRRKPAYVVKSPSADEPGEREAHSSTRKRATPPYSRIAPRRASSDTDTTQSSSNNPSTSNPVAIPRNAPLLPLYHPLGTLALSLPKLDPGLFGLPGVLNVGDPDEQGDGETGTSSSRVRRGAPKARETGDDESLSTGTPNGTGKAAQDVGSRERDISPRKRRGGGGGTKRKRKEADDGDAGFPPPAKRTRNPRGAANNSVPSAPSPLVGPAIAASDLVEDAPENTGEGEDEAQEEVQAPKRSSRTRKPRRPAKRRDSSGSASTGTSVSVPIAAAAKAAAQAQADAARSEAEDDARPLAEVVNGVREGEAETVDVPAVHVGNSIQSVQKEAVPPPPEVPPTTSDAADGLEIAVKGSREKPPDGPMHGVTPPPVIAQPAPVSPPVPQQEEREEGELSDDGLARHTA